MSSECCTQITGTSSARARSTRVLMLAITPSRSWALDTTSFWTSITTSALFGRSFSVVIVAPSASLPPGSVSVLVDEREDTLGDLRRTHRGRVEPGVIVPAAVIVHRRRRESAASTLTTALANQQRVEIAVEPDPQCRHAGER